MTEKLKSDPTDGYSDIDLSDCDFDVDFFKDDVDAGEGSKRESESSDNKSSDSESSDSDTIPVEKKRKLKIENDTKEDMKDLIDVGVWVDVKEEPQEEIKIEMIDPDEDDEWEDVTEQEYTPFKFDFKTFPLTTGPQISEDVKSPIDFFKLYFTDTLISSIINETNNFANYIIREKRLSKKSIWRSWVDVNRDEFLAFIGVILNMGTMQLDNIQEYWSTRYNSRIQFYSDIFTRARFQQIFWMLHMRTIPPENRNPRTHLQKVSKFLDHINSMCSKHFIPGRDICICESVVTSKGKIEFETHNLSESSESKVKMYVLVDSETGYIYSILPYYGSITREDLTNSELPISTMIPLELYKNISENIPNAEGYHIYTDEYYASVSLANELIKLKCHLTGVIETNRKGLPRAIRKPKFVGKTTIAYRKNRTLVLAWKHKRVATLISTSDVPAVRSVDRIVRGRRIPSIRKPLIVRNYIKNMKGASRANQYSSTYCFMTKGLKWWRKLFFWGLEVCVINSYLLYKMKKFQRYKTPMKHLKFVKLLVDQLVGDFRQGAVSQDQHSPFGVENRLNNKIHILRSGKKRDCIVCSNRRIPHGRKETHTYCDTCDKKPHMHIGDCFEKYHKLKNYK